MPVFTSSWHWASETGQTGRGRRSCLSLAALLVLAPCASLAEVVFDGTMGAGGTPALENSTWQPVGF